MHTIPCLNYCDLLGREGAEIDSTLKTYERIYIGSYFCGKYFIHMNTEYLDHMLETILSEGKEKPAITLVVPMFGQRDLEEGKQKLAKLLDQYREVIDEITVNDYGMLTYIGEVYDYPMNIGRLLMKDYRDPRYVDYYQSTMQPKIFTDYFKRLRKKYRIQGVELDPTHVSIDLSEAPEDLVIGVHGPFCYITMGQTCEFASVNKTIDHKYRPNSECGNECVHYHILYHPQEDVEWMRLGRAVYFYNPDVKITGTSKIREIYFPVKDLKMACKHEEVC